MTFLKYLWRIISCIVQLVIILYVFSTLQTRTEHIVVSILGLIYVTIKGSAAYQSLFIAQLALGTANELLRLRELAGEDPDVIREIRNQSSKGETAFFSGPVIIGTIFLTLVSIICLLDLFSHLMRA